MEHASPPINTLIHNVEESDQTTNNNSEVDFILKELYDLLYIIDPRDVSFVYDRCKGKTFLFYFV